MDIKDLEHGSGKRILAGVSGSVYRNLGEILISKAAHVGIDSNLLRVLELAVDDLKLQIDINSIDTGQHVTGSRHYSGRAVDIWRVCGMGERWAVARVENFRAVQLVRWLMEEGWKNRERGDWGGVLLGPPHSHYNATSVNHITHIHVSVAAAPGAADGEADGEPEEEKAPDSGSLG